VYQDINNLLYSDKLYEDALKQGLVPKDFNYEEGDVSMSYLAYCPLICLFDGRLDEYDEIVWKKKAQLMKSLGWSVDKAYKDIFDGRSKIDSLGISYEDVMKKLSEWTNTQLPEEYLGDYTESSLINAVRNGNVDIVKKCLVKGLNPDIKEGLLNNPILYIATSKGYKDIVELLLKYGADPNIKNNDATPLLLASSRGDKEIVELLLNHGADPNFKNKYDDTPLYQASRKKYKDIVDLLKKYGAKE
jgi:hypothetical protein